MKINSGHLRGAPILTPEHIRPTSSKVRNAVINMFRDFIYDKHVLDLYAGSGAVGIHCFSEGAQHITFVDNNMESISSITHNTMNFSQHVTICHMPATKFITNTNNQYDLIFCDPPFIRDAKLNKKEIINITSLILQRNICASSGYMILETHKHIAPSILSLFIRPVTVKFYGDTALLIYRQENYVTPLVPTYPHNTPAI